VSIVYDCNFLFLIIDTLQIHPPYSPVDHPIYLVVDRFEHLCLECFIIFLSANYYGFDLASYLHDRYLVLEPAILACTGIFPFLDSTFIDDPIDNRHIRFLQIFSILYSRRHYPHTLPKINECIYLPFTTDLEEAVRIICKHDWWWISRDNVNSSGFQFFYNAFYHIVAYLLIPRFEERDPDRVIVRIIDMVSAIIRFIPFQIWTQVLKKVIRIRVAYSNLWHFRWCLDLDFTIIFTEGLWKIYHWKIRDQTVDISIVSHVPVVCKIWMFCMIDGPYTIVPVNHMSFIRFILHHFEYLGLQVRPHKAHTTFSSYEYYVILT